jgi:recombination protein RecA
MEIMFNEGISKEGSLIDLGNEKSVITKSGSFYSYGNTRLGQGREAARKFLKANTDIRDEIELKIRCSEAGIPLDGETAEAPVSG